MFLIELVLTVLLCLTGTFASSPPPKKMIRSRQVEEVVIRVLKHYGLQVSLPTES
jgi:hypothetical protein